MEAEINRLNKELETRTDYESDSYMELIENVSALSEKFYAIDSTNYEEDVEKALLGLGFNREDFNRQTSEMCRRDRVYSVGRLCEPCLEHIDNNFKPLDIIQKGEFADVTEDIIYLLQVCRHKLGNNDYEHL